MIFTLNIDARITSIVSANADVKGLNVLKRISEPELSDIYYYVRKTFICLSMPSGTVIFRCLFKNGTKATKVYSP